MTEQEKRENAVEEMVRDIPEKVKVMFSQTDYILLSEYLRKTISMALIKKGYRKIPDGAVVLTQEMAYQYREDLAKVKYLKDEIRKETAKEILLRVKSFLEEQTKTVKQLSKPTMGSHAIPQNCVECYEGSQDNRLDELRRLAKEYGVEVE